MKVDIYTSTGEKTGRQIDLPDNVFGVEPNEHIVYLSVRQYLANQRQGTHKAKERNEIAGSTRKIKKQKGTGTARAGSLKNPLFRSGGRVFGPKPRNYGFKLNKKVKRLARFVALSDKLRQSEIRVVEDFTFDAPKTKQYDSFLNSMMEDRGKAVHVINEQDNNLYLSCRNIQSVKLVEARNLSTYDVLNNKLLLVSESAVQSIIDSAKTDS